jgi:hypothetical protein
MVMMYRKDELTGIDVPPDKVNDFKNDGYTTSKNEALAASYTPGGSNYTGSTTDTSSSSTSTGEGKTITRAEVYKTLPWLKKYAGADADKLVDAYVKGFIDSDGNTTTALAEMRFGESADAYKRVFKNIINEDTGALRMTESEYISGLESVLTTLTEYSLGGYASGKGKDVWAELVKNSVSPEAYRARVGTSFNLINEVDQELKQSIINQYNEYYSSQTGTSINMSIESILALAIDPNINNDILSGRLNASELGAIYSGTVGDKIDLTTVERYIGAGLSTSEAERTFAIASTTARLYGRLARKQKRDTSLGKAATVLESTLFGDELITGQIKSIGAQVLAESSVQAGAAKSQTGGVIGLTEQ